MERLYGRRAGDVSVRQLPPRRFFWAYLFANGVWFALGIAAIIGAVTYYVSPEALHDSSVGAQSGVLAVAWNTMYLAAGVLLVTGLLTCTRPVGWRLELAGLSLITASITINALAVAVHLGIRGAATVATYVALGAASALRAYAVVTLMGVTRT